MTKEVSASYVEMSDQLSEDQQQRGLNDSNVIMKHYQTLLEEHERCGSPQYQEILPCTCDKAGDNKNSVVSQSPKHEVKEQTAEGRPQNDFTEKPSSHLVLAIASLFICIFCWPAAPCAILATVYAIQVGPLWESRLYKKAKSASDKTKELAITALVCGGINASICFVLALTSALVVLGLSGYLSYRLNL